VSIKNRGIIDPATSQILGSVALSLARTFIQVFDGPLNKCSSGRFQAFAGSSA
jgi:hypothetical protein